MDHPESGLGARARRRIGTLDPARTPTSCSGRATRSASTRAPRKSGSTAPCATTARRPRLAHRLRARLRADAEAAMPRPASAPAGARRRRRQLPGAPRAAVAITGGKVFPVSGRTIENATVVIVDGKSPRSAPTSRCPPARRRRREGQVGHARPDQRATALGLVEVGAVPGPTTRGAGRAQRRRRLPRVGRAEPGLGAVVAGAQRGHHPVVTLPSGGLMRPGGVPTPSAPPARRCSAGLRSRWWQPRRGRPPAPSRGEVLLRLRELLDDARTTRRRSWPTSAPRRGPSAAGAASRGAAAGDRREAAAGGRRRPRQGHRGALDLAREDSCA